jgi:hypothetical protein
VTGGDPEAKNAWRIRNDSSSAASTLLGLGSMTRVNGRRQSEQVALGGLLREQIRT